MAVHLPYAVLLFSLFRLSPGISEISPIISNSGLVLQHHAFKLILASILVFFFYYADALNVDFPSRSDVQNPVHGLYVKWTVLSTDNIFNPISITLVQITSKNMHLVESSSNINITVGKSEFNMPVFNTSSYSLHLSDTETNYVVDNFTISADSEPDNALSSSELSTTSGVLRPSHGTDTEFKTDTAASALVTSGMSLSTSRIINQCDETVMSPSTTSESQSTISATTSSASSSAEPTTASKPNPPLPDATDLLLDWDITIGFAAFIFAITGIISGVILWRWNMKRGEPSEHDDRFVLYYWPQSADPAAPNFQIATEGGFESTCMRCR